MRINYPKVISQANEIKDDAMQLSDCVKSLNKMEQDCRRVWKGEAAETFLCKLVAFREEMRRTSIQMDNLAATIKNCADRIKREDEAAAQRAAALKNHY